jgi:aspartyl-tRNA(Asn)/glutamyl-tRNA(Gln) amidotransferase subunit B
MNSFRSVFRALEFEAKRQVETLEAGGRIAQETRGWVDDSEITVSQRTKEYASDYRYFPEPDLPPLVIQPEWVDSIRESLPELPRQRMARFVSEFGLSEYDAELLTTTKASADYFERAVESGNAEGQDERDLAKSVSNWLLGEMARLLNQTELTIDDVKIAPDQIVELQNLVKAGTLNSNMAKDVFERMFESGGSPAAIAEAEGLVQISDTDAVNAAVAEAIAANPQPVQDYLDGKETAIRFLVGQVMKATRGKANPQIATEMLNDKLEALR